MSRSFFVQPDLVRLPLFGGENYIEVKRALTNREQRRIFTNCVATAHAGEKLTLDMEKVGKTKILEYVLGWGGPGFIDPVTQRTVGFSEGALDLLDTDTYGEIVRVLEAHEADELAKRDAEKNGPDGVTSSTPISPSAN